MNQEELTNITNSITEKVGEDVAATIADDFGILITKNQEILNSIAEKDKMISDLQDRNSKLVASMVLYFNKYQKHLLNQKKVQ